MKALADAAVFFNNNSEDSNLESINAPSSMEGLHS
jgi:hypothetical protein